jgi:hypothetical protein
MNALSFHSSRSVDSYDAYRIKVWNARWRNFCAILWKFGWIPTFMIAGWECFSSHGPIKIVIIILIAYAVTVLVPVGLVHIFCIRKVPRERGLGPLK